MTVQEKARLEHYKTLGTLHRDQIDDYFYLRLMDEGYVQGIRLPIEEMPQPEIKTATIEDIQPQVAPVVEEVPVTASEPIQVLTEEGVPPSEEQVMEKLQVHSEGGEN